MSVTSSSSVKYFDVIYQKRQSFDDCNISPLELEAFIAVKQFASVVENIAVSEMLPRTPELIFVNLTTLEGLTHCLELTSKGWRITSLKTDCMNGDFTKMELFTNYYNTFNELMNFISPGYQKYLKNEKLEINYKNFCNSAEYSSSSSLEEISNSNNSLFSSSS